MNKGTEDNCHTTIIDFIFGPKESQIIGNTDHFPVLCINERDDLYVLCQ